MKQVKPLSDKRLNRLFALLEGSFFSIMFLADGIISEILSILGYGDAFIGVALAAIGVACLVLQPLFGFLCDRYRCYRAIFLTVFTVVAVAMPLFYRYSGSKAVVLAYCVVALGSVKSLFMVLDSWVSKLQKQGVGIDYGRLRSVGSITYAFAAMILSLGINRFGVRSSVWMYLFIFAVMVYALVQLPDPAEGALDSEVSLSTAARAMFRRRNVAVFLGCAFLGWITFNSQLMFTSRLISSLGGSVADVGLASFVMAFVEFFVVLNYSRIAARIGTENTLILGFFGYFLKGIAMYLSPTAGWGIAVQVLQGVSYALFIPGVVRFLGEQIPRRYLATAFVLYQTLCQTISLIGGSPLFGAVAQKYSVSAMLGIFSFPALLSAVLFLIYCRSSAFDRTRLSEEDAR